MASPKCGNLEARLARSPIFNRKKFDFSKVALDSGTHDMKTEQAEEVQIFNDQLSAMLSYIFIPP